ncbi:hypothetical protein ACFONL_13040 [Camelimonas fluminis]|uniref:Uncharacterized protein n=3 Tax=Chelatococcaceae TaxID=2036754 RepID=A0ABV7UI77_9HYPH|nr:hypothetical protein [Camelimonas fluminis]
MTAQARALFQRCIDSDQVVAQICCYMGDMNLTHTKPSRRLAGMMRTVLVAALTFALLGMSMASADVTSCASAVHSVERSVRNDVASDAAEFHSSTSAVGKPSGVHAARCCTSVCSLCTAPAATGWNEKPRPVLAKHRLDRGDPIFGILIGQPH